MEYSTSVIIVTYNSRHLIDRCLGPIYHDDSLEIVVVDNNSSDGTARYIEENYPRVLLDARPDNLGFAKGNNVGIALSKAPVVLLLNPDAFVAHSDQIRELSSQLMSDPRLAVVGPQLLNADGSHQTGDCGWRDSLLNTAGHMLLLHRITPAFRAIYLTNPALLTHDQVDVDWICGACLMVRRTTLDRLGGLDERIFMYGEDVEFGERVRDAGFRVAYAPKVKVTHLQGATQKPQSGGFYSTKWLDVRARKWAARSTVRFEIFRGLCVAGFAMRAAALTVTSRGRADKLGKAALFWRYLRHTISLRAARE